ncbi:MAG: flagellar motor protein [Desulfobulbaceae bacterium]|jgi:chemotaxis protein MotA|nr:flagellar motor protein [Desulfobulbaceae bacterium]
MDIAPLIGLILGFGAVLGGAVLEGLHISSLIQPTAAIIVLGGTFGATFTSFPLSVAIGAFRDASKVFKPASLDESRKLIADICAFAAQARKNGLLALEQEAKNHKDRFMRKAISLSVDGVDPADIQGLLETDMTADEEHAKMSAEFFEAAGGYAPTIGIIGAVLGLIHVMSNLEDTSKLGAGIAVAFVATIYGLVVANIVCLPIASKIKFLIKEETVRKEIIIAGICAMQSGQNPRLIGERLNAFLGTRAEKAAGASEGGS